MTSVKFGMDASVTDSPCYNFTDAVVNGLCDRLNVRPFVLGSAEASCDRTRGKYLCRVTWKEWRHRDVAQLKLVCLEGRAIIGAVLRDAHHDEALDVFRSLRRPWRPDVV